MINYYFKQRRQHMWKMIGVVIFAITLAFGGAIVGAAVGMCILPIYVFSWIANSGNGNHHGDDEI
jgi:hypothetical protein